MTTAVEPEEDSRFERLPPLLAILAAPVPTMRRILAAGRDPLRLPILLVGFISISLASRDKRSAVTRFGEASSVGDVALVIGSLILGAALFGLLFCLFAWIASVVGRNIFDGRGTARDLRGAMAWGSVPMVWALLFRLPAAIWLPGSETVGLVELGNGILVGVVLLSLEIVAWAACLVITTFTISAAHEIPPGDALGTLLLTLATPVVFGIAAALASGGS